jgi:hypothetical protein
MKIITDEIEHALSFGLHYLAIIGTLTLPDICGALESFDGRATGSNYKAWWDQWMSSQYPKLTSTDLYSMRCGVLHQGRLGHPNCQYARIIFTAPKAGTPSGSAPMLHNNIFNDALNLDADEFCRDMIKAVLDWYFAKQTDVHVQANFPHLVRLYENGLLPYINAPLLKVIS